MVIGERPVDRQHPYIIGEVALAHDGSLSLAHSYVDAVAEAGASAVKFQMHTPHRAQWRIPPRWPQDEDRCAYWKRTSFTRDQWVGLKEHAEDSGLHMLISPFSLEAFHEVKCIGVPAWKVPSGKIRDRELLKRMRNTGLPVLLSTGMSDWDEIVAAVRVFSPDKLAVLQCSSLYPTPPQQVGISAMIMMSHRYTAYVGLSDHSGTIYPSLVALHEGACVIEVHVVLNKRMLGFDTSSSITPAELEQIVEGASFIRDMEYVDKNDLEPYQEAREVFM